MLEAERALVQYYDRRAQEYEGIYRRSDPVRQSELDAMKTAVRKTLCNRRVLEVACGTGFWTEIVAEIAQHVVAVDLSPRMLAIARGKRLTPSKVEFRHGDAYRLESVPGAFDAGLANFWLSHIPEMRLEAFLRGFHQRLGSGAVVFMADNVYASGDGYQLVTIPGWEDTFRRRKLANGSEHLVLKNYYNAHQLRDILIPWAGDLKIQVNQCYWWVHYVVS